MRRRDLLLHPIFAGSAAVVAAVVVGRPGPAVSLGIQRRRCDMDRERRG